MVFDKLKDGLQAAMTGLRKAVVLDKKTVREYTKEIQKTLLSADVNVKLVFDLSKNIEERGFLEKPPGMLDKRENLIRITYEELVKLIGKGDKLPIEEGEKILLVGTQGSGKTTTAAKLASYFLRRGLHPRLICADTFRPAAYDQLKQLSEEIHIPFYGEPAEKDALKIIEAALSKFGAGGPTIIDSEGRHSLDDDLMRDINRIYNEVKPDKTLLVLDSTVGQRAGEQAAAFKKACNVDGVILTKLDGSAKGGGALSACASTNAPVYFIGVGEHIEDLEEFEPDRFVSRIIGFGDLQGLLEKAKEVEFDEESTSRLMSGKFTLDDLYQQIEQIQKMGSISKLMDMLPFGAKVPKGTMDVQEEKLTLYKVIIDSMTDEEKQNPEEIKKSRLERISRGSGRKPEEVRDLLNYHKKMKSMMKNLGDERKLRRFMKRFGANA
jgi:signal recognition particle subunit SRP54